MRVVVDGVGFQLSDASLTRIWSSVLPRLAKYSDLELVMLDRGNAPAFSGIEQVEFPSYSTDICNAADSFLIETFCKELGADVFTSTYYTTPVSTPSMLVVYDMAAEILGSDLHARRWQEKEIAIGFAMNYICLSETTKAELARRHPETRDRATVAHCGVARDIFSPRPREDVERFKAKTGIRMPYYMLTGSREPENSNAILAFQALGLLGLSEVELLCVGGEPHIAAPLLAALPPGMGARQLSLTDSDLALAYSGAEALVFPSRYQGFALSIVEAMACGCPVIATPEPSIREVAGEAAICISPDDADALAHAMVNIRDPNLRTHYIRLGYEQAARYDWDRMVQTIRMNLFSAHRIGRDEAMRDFFGTWKRLRRLQAALDPH